MAIKLTEEERNNRIKLVGEYYINTPNASVRSTSQYFKENYFDISIATVSNYIDLYKKLYPNKAKIVDDVIESRTPKTVEDKYIRDRVLKEAKMILQGFTIEQISELNDIEYWVVYRDLGERLKKVDIELYAAVCTIFNQNSLDNLNYRKK
ncbi:MAG: sporulation transcriptional regulator SpoIIID [Bacilli bacterium]|nr:sporulation transcriptional regulator SpoIIID [Bacilli bacterium]